VKRYLVVIDDDVTKTATLVASYEEACGLLFHSLFGDRSEADVLAGVENGTTFWTPDELSSGQYNYKENKSGALSVEGELGVIYNFDGGERNFTLIEWMRDEDEYQPQPDDVVWETIGKPLGPVEVTP
jgi:hypothetical protein